MGIPREIERIEPTREEVRAAIEKVNSRFSEGFVEGDASITASGYAEDASVLPPDGEIVRGKGPIEKFWQGVMDSGVREAKLTTVEVSVGGGYAQEMGTGVLTIQASGKDLSKQNIKYVVVWERTKEGWKNKWDIWNNSP